MLPLLTSCSAPTPVAWRLLLLLQLLLLPSALLKVGTGTVSSDAVAAAPGTPPPPAATGGREALHQAALSVYTAVCAPPSTPGPGSAAGHSRGGGGGGGGGGGVPPGPGASPNEQWDFYSRHPGPLGWTDVIGALNGGRGLTAMQELMGLVGLASIMQQAVDFVREAVTQRRHRLAGYGGARLNYIFIGNPGTGKVSDPFISPTRDLRLQLPPPPTPLPVHCPAALQTSVARIWARLQGQLGLRPNAEEEEARTQALSLAAAGAGAAATASEADRARADLAQQRAAIELGKYDTLVRAAQMVLDDRQSALRDLQQVAASVGSVPVADSSALAAKRSIEAGNAGVLDAAVRGVRWAEEQLRERKSERDRFQAALDAAAKQLQVRPCVKSGCGRSTGSSWCGCACVT
jgi:hypothetical protein